MTYAEGLSRFPGKKRTKSPGKHAVQCPVCQGDGKKHGSGHLLTWEGTDGWWHVKCTIENCDEVAILNAVGLTQEDRCLEDKSKRPERDDKWKPNWEQPDERYDYKDGEGKYLFSKVKFYCAWGKEMRQCIYKGGGGGRPVAFELRGLGDQAKILYRLGLVHEAVKSGSTLYLNEGEKAVDVFKSKRLFATCGPDGADDAGDKWLDKYTALVHGVGSLVIIADRDERGEAYAKNVYRKLSAAGIEARILSPALETKGADAFDHFQAGFEVDDFIQRPDLMGGPQKGLLTKTHSEVFEPVVMEHLVKPYLPKGKCVLFDADGGTGKTTMAVAWAAALSRGVHPLTFESLPGGPVKTLYLHKGEDSDDEIETVYRANGGQPGFLHYVGEDQAPGLKFDKKGLRLVQETIEEGGFGLVVVDALFYFINGVVQDASKALDVVDVVAGMNRVAMLTGATFLNIRHTVKGVVNTAASNLGMGSVQFRNSHRGQLVARWHPEHKGHMVVVTDEKGSLLNARGTHFCYRREGNEVQYVHGIDDPFQQDGSVKKKPSTKVEQAEAIINDMLRDGPRLSTEIFAACAVEGISERTIGSARANLKVIAFRYPSRDPDRPWYSKLPGQDDYDPEKDHD
ncbi:hypothetical protein EON81_02980 [bacterium]|nr:MAG: hypothetical protein EON81_02980 [bacterium]